MPLNMKHTIMSLLPDGPLWKPVEEEDLDNLLSAHGENADREYDIMRGLSYVREPYLTDYLEDLEREYGIVSDETLSDDTRREQLHARKYARPGFGLDYLQDKLQAAGFDVVVRANDPRVDPRLILGDLYYTVAGGDPGAGTYPVQWAGYYTNVVGPPEYLSVAGYYNMGGYILANGPIMINQSPRYMCVANNQYMNADDIYAYAGYFLSMKYEYKEYEIPECPCRWALIFFIAESFPETWPEDLTTIVPASIPNERRQEFERIILRCKPLHTWAGIVANYT